HPTDNPSGVRVAIQDAHVNYLGTRDESLWSEAEMAAGFGFANYYFDNVGVQYGLKALMDGAITAEQFVDLNEKIGGVDIDYNHQPMRTQIDPEVAQILYRTGFINDWQRMGNIPIITERPPEPDPIASHTMYHTYAARYRLNKAQGDTDNYITWLRPVGWVYYTWDDLGFTTMDKWLEGIAADQSDLSMADKVVVNKPPEAVNGYWPDITQPMDFSTLNDFQFDWGAENLDPYPPYMTPRLVAAQGNLEAVGIVKAQLKPLERSDYAPVVFTDDQWARLQATFPDGVCDWTQPSIGATPSIPWLTFKNGPGGEPIGINQYGNTYQARNCSGEMRFVDPVCMNLTLR
ncbi:MAG: hypothetical protein HKP58_04635, partial [Desulfatitalea sp.]|nr:hypothetical protein [Desulfatitalea sp.]